MRLVILIRINILIKNDVRVTLFDFTWEKARIILAAKNFVRHKLEILRVNLILMHKTTMSPISPHQLSNTGDEHRSIVIFSFFLCENEVTAIVFCQ